MRPRPICLSKVSSSPDNGGGGGVPWRSIASAPLGVPILVRPKGGQAVAAVRGEYAPVWQDGNRDQALGFTPDEWRPLADS